MRGERTRKRLAAWSRRVLGGPGTPDRRQSTVQERSSRQSTVRAQSESLAVVFMLVISVVAATVLVGASASVLEDTRNGAELERNEQAMTVLDNRASQVALGEQEHRTVALGDSGRGSYDVHPDAGWIRVTHKEYVSGETEVIYNGTLGAVEYTSGDKTVAYQGGGVWRASGNGSVMVSPPEFHYRDGTLTLPVVRVQGEDAAAGTVRASVTRAGTDKIFPNSSTAGASGAGSPYDSTGDPYGNVIDQGTIVVTVHSDYYQAWAEYFRTRTDQTVVTVDHAAQTATVKLSVQPAGIAINAALAATSTSSTLRLETAGAADTYNSAEGPYDPATAETATVKTRGDVLAEDTIGANVRAEGDVTVDGGTLDGYACAEGDIRVQGGGHVTGWTNDTTCTVEVPDYPLPDNEITDKVSRYASPSENDNHQTACIQAGEVVADCTGADRLTAGTYYLSEGEIENRDIEIDTSGGPVELVVNDDLKIAGVTTEIDIVTTDPTHGVTVYVNGRFKVEGDDSDGPRVETDANQTASLLVAKVASDNDVRFEGNSSFVGVIYAPGTGCGSDTAKIETGAEIFGAVVFECPDNVETVGNIHFDRALSSDTATDVENAINFLYLTENTVRVELE